MKDDDYLILIERLRNASGILRANDALLQAVARGYYVVFTVALQAAERQGLAFRRGSGVDDDRRATHQVLPNLLRALYLGQNSGPVIGAGPGVIRAGCLEPHIAFRHANQLQKDRKYADYGYGTVAEPYDAVVADERLHWANHLVEDLETLL